VAGASRRAMRIPHFARCPRRRPQRALPREAGVRNARGTTRLPGQTRASRPSTFRWTPRPIITPPPRSIRRSMSVPAARAIIRDAGYALLNSPKRCERSAGMRGSGRGGHALRAEMVTWRRNQGCSRTRMPSSTGRAAAQLLGTSPREVGLSIDTSP
jgi:hypothetical protein